MQLPTRIHINSIRAQGFHKPSGRYGVTYQNIVYSWICWLWLVKLSCKGSKKGLPVSMMILSGAMVEWQDLNNETEGGVEEIPKHYEIGTGWSSLERCGSECKSGPRAHVTSWKNWSGRLSSCQDAIATFRLAGCGDFLLLFLPFRWYKLFTSSWCFQTHGVIPIMFCIFWMRWDRIDRPDIYYYGTMNNSWVACLPG